MNEDALRARLAGLARQSYPTTQADAAAAGDDGLVPAAVLVPVVLGTRPHILLTKRTAHLARHAGQVSFPGGRIDPGDPTAESAALREAREEIGLDPGLVALQGRLPPFVTGTGFRITPVVGVLQAEPTLVIAPDEVESVFELPLDVLLDRAAPQRRVREEAGQRREFWVWPHKVHYIWGATAAILVRLAQVLRGEDGD